MLLIVSKKDIIDKIILLTFNINKVDSLPLEKNSGGAKFIIKKKLIEAQFSSSPISDIHGF